MPVPAGLHEEDSLDSWILLISFYLWSIDKDIG